MDGDRSRAIRERIRGTFDRAARDYAQLERSREFFQGLSRELIAFVPSLRGARILDVGCGSGASLEVLKREVGADGAAFGLDVSLGMLREAKRQVGESAHLILADGCNFDGVFRSCFDAVVYNAVLFLLPNASTSLECAFKVLRPGGWVLIASLEGLYLDPGHRPVVDVLAAAGYVPGRHAVSSWASVESTLGKLFPFPEVQERVLPISVDEFVSFYSLEPMSAGLLPSLSFPERKLAVESLAFDWRRRGWAPRQVWTLAAARKPTGGET